MKIIYQTHIKPVYEDRFLVALMEWDATSNKEKEERDALVKPVTVVLRNEVGRELFLSECYGSTW